MAAPHASLLTLLRCLDRDDVQSLYLASDEVATASRTQGVVPLTQVPLSMAQLTALLQHTDMGLALPNLAAAESTLDTLVADRWLRVGLRRAGGQLQVRIARRPQAANVPEATAAVAPPAPPPAPVAARRDSIDLGRPRPAPVPAAPTTPSPTSTPTPSPTVSPSASPSPETLPPTPSVRQAPSAAAFGPSAAAPLSPRDNALTYAQATDALGAMVAQARARNASDLHLVGQSPLRLRVAGKLAAHGEAIDAEGLRDLGMALLSPAQEAVLMAQGYLDIALDLPQGGRVRANISRHPLGLKICLRLVPAQVPTLESLGLPPDLAAVAKYHQGLAIVSGPSGHGKSSTLAALIDLINGQSAHHIISVEDPIEVVHPVRRSVISQREVGAHTTSYARALKAALRQDPDVIVIGELRDRETVEIALTAAETGHLVIATMNTRSAAKTIDRLIDLFGPEDQAQVRATLAGSLKMVISQRLVPSSQGGMVAAVELLTGGVPLWALIRDNKLVQLPSLQQRGRSAGMIRLDTSLLALVRAGTITADAARVYVENPPEFERLLKEA